MKKIFGILGVAVVAATMFFSANSVNGSAREVSLTSLTTMNTANAECVTSSISSNNTGGCSPLTGNCYANDSFRPDRCDPFGF